MRSLLQMARTYSDSELNSCLQQKKIAKTLDKTNLSQVRYKFRLLFYSMSPVTAKAIMGKLLGRNTMPRISDCCHCLIGYSCF